MNIGVSNFFFKYSVVNNLLPAINPKGAPKFGKTPNTNIIISLLNGISRKKNSY